MKKTIYFVRHGQTVLNKQGVHQFHDTPLSERGHEQAIRAAEYFATVPVDVVIASSLIRAQETAQPIALKTGKSIETCELFVELRRPRSLWGVSWFHPRSLYVMGLLYLFASRKGWHYSDEENLDEFHERSRAALEYLAARPEEHLVVVTHRGFMAAMLGRIKRDGKDSVAQYRRALWKNLLIDNGCFFKVTWVPEGENGATLTGTWTVVEGPTCPQRLL